jgi:two-component system response regulator PilR (NtrC family)
LTALEAYAFPGNVRELENILERAITLSISGEIRAADIQLRPTPASALGASNSMGEGALGDHLEDIERDAILKALEQTRYNKTAAAKVLGMSFRALRYRIKKLGIE